jgi:hypothetical protein
MKKEFDQWNSWEVRSSSSKIIIMVGNFREGGSYEFIYLDNDYLKDHRFESALMVICRQDRNVYSEQLRLIADAVKQAKTRAFIDRSLDSSLRSYNSYKEQEQSKRMQAALNTTPKLREPELPSYSSDTVIVTRTYTVPVMTNRESLSNEELISLAKEVPENEWEILSESITVLNKK